ncbi:Uncharacterised protein [Mycobacteroides abscessus]|nr:Uncharacterised protein [Mycobacteroides abscessus]
MSVEDRSCFSYQVAAGSTTSENSVVDVIRKSSVTSRSSLPRGASSRHVIDRGRRSGPDSAALTAASVPRRCWRKYSLPLPDDPRMFARHTVTMRGKFAGSSGSSHANRRVPALSSSTTCCAGSLPAARASSTRSSGLRSNVG